MRLPLIVALSASFSLGLTATPAPRIAAPPLPPRAPESTPRRRPNMSANNKTLVFDPSKADESNVPRILGLGITFYTLALVAFGLRMYTRAVIVRSFGKDDVLMILCMVCRPLCRVMHGMVADLVFLLSWA